MGYETYESEHTGDDVYIAGVGPYIVDSADAEGVEYQNAIYGPNSNSVLKDGTFTSISVTGTLGVLGGVTVDGGIIVNTGNLVMGGSGQSIIVQDASDRSAVVLAESGDTGALSVFNAGNIRGTLECSGNYGRLILEDADSNDDVILSASGTSSIANAVTLGSTLTVTGAGTFSADLTVTDDINVKSGATIYGIFGASAGYGKLTLYDADTNEDVVISAGGTSTFVNDLYLGSNLRFTANGQTIVMEDSSNYDTWIVQETGGYILQSLRKNDVTRIALSSDDPYIYMYNSSLQKSLALDGDSGIGIVTVYDDGDIRGKLYAHASGYGQLILYDIDENADVTLSASGTSTFVNALSLSSTLTVAGDTTLNGDLYMGTNDYIYLQDGLAAGPALSFTGAPTTGIWRTGDNTIGFAVGGSGRVEIGSTDTKVEGELSVTYSWADRVVLTGGATAGQIELFMEDGANDSSWKVIPYDTGTESHLAFYYDTGAGYNWKFNFSDIGGVWALGIYAESKISLRDAAASNVWAEMVGGVLSIYDSGGSSGGAAKISLNAGADSYINTGNGLIIGGTSTTAAFEVVGWAEFDTINVTDTADFYSSVEVWGNVHKIVEMSASADAGIFKVNSGGVAKVTVTAGTSAVFADPVTCSGTLGVTGIATFSEDVMISSASNQKEFICNTPSPGLNLNDTDGVDFRIGVNGGYLKISIDTDGDDTRDASYHYDDYPNALVVDSSGNMSLGSATPLAKLHVFEPTVLGGTAGDYQVITRVVNYVTSAYSYLRRNDWTYRLSTADTYQSSCWHDSILVGSETTGVPHGVVSTRCWCERWPSTGSHVWGHQATTYMTLTATELEVAGNIEPTGNIAILDSKYITFGTDVDWSIGSNASTNVLVFGTGAGIGTPKMSLTTAGALSVTGQATFGGPEIVVAHTTNPAIKVDASSATTSPGKINLVADRGSASPPNNTVGLIEVANINTASVLTTISGISFNCTGATLSGGYIDFYTKTEAGALTANVTIDDAGQLRVGGSGVVNAQLDVRGDAVVTERITVGSAGNEVGICCSLANALLFDSGATLVITSTSCYIEFAASGGCVIPFPQLLTGSVITDIHIHVYDDDGGAQWKIYTRMTTFGDSLPTSMVPSVLSSYAGSSSGMTSNYSGNYFRHNLSTDITIAANSSYWLDIEADSTPGVTRFVGVRFVVQKAVY